jgi:uncharacterized membrane protein
MDKKYIEKWLEEGLINQDQAQKMLADISDYKKEQSSSKLIVTLSTIGAILVGIGAILFIASNWQVMPNAIKVLVLLGFTLGSYYLGYILKYQKQTLPKVGASLIFLASLLFGATVFLVAQMYHINANNHTLVLVWLAGIIPLVYVLKTKPIAGLSCLLFYIWIGLFVFRNVSLRAGGYGDFYSLPVLYLVSGILMFGIGGLHYLSVDLKDVARIYRIAGIKISMLALFLLTFRFFSGHYAKFNIRADMVVSDQFKMGLVIFSLLAIFFTIINLLLNPSKTDTSVLESTVGLGLLAIALLFFFFPATTNIYVLLFNLILAGIIFLLIFIGHQRGDMRLVNIGMGFLSLLVIVRYFDFFWDLLPRALFFMTGGVILVLGGIALEKKRRELKAKFGG